MGCDTIITNLIALLGVPECGLRERHAFLNPLDLIWFVPAWGSKKDSREDGEWVWSVCLLAILLTVKPGSTYEPGFLCWCCSGVSS
ncbi:hypothetical protein EMIT013CA1_250026 [Bacillus sp. IT-13CA1]